MNALPKGVHVLKASSMLFNKVVYHSNCNQNKVKRAENKLKRNLKDCVDSFPRKQGPKSVPLTQRMNHTVYFVANESLEISLYVVFLKVFDME